MTDRMDIDALLIGALYGELTPADEARLTAHLESHPADRTALADLTRTRAAVRESRIFAVQLEPPQSVSALLLQEAARRAPRPPREESSWFHRFTRSFMAHPALAAAMTCVIVAGVAGTLYVRHGDKLAEDSASREIAGGAVSTPRSEAPAEPATQAPPPAAAVAPRPAPPAPDPTGGGSTREGFGADKPGTKVDTKAYGVRLDEAAKQSEERPLGKLVGAKDRRVAPAAAAADNDDADIAKPDRFSAPPPRSPVADAKKAQKTAKGIVLRSPELEPMELKNKTADRGEVPARRAAGAGGTTARDQLAQAPSAGAAPPPPPPPSAQPAAPAPEPVASNAAPAPSKPVVVAKRPAAGPGAAQGAPSNAANTGTGNAGAQRDRRLADQSNAPADGKTLDEKERANDTVLGWAQKQREQVIAHVRSNNCRAAANAAVEIYNRAPDYYASNVATDRSIKPCLAYLNSERQREDRARAAKRANAVDAAPAQAVEPPPTKK